MPLVRIWRELWNTEKISVAALRAKGPVFENTGRQLAASRFERRLDILRSGIDDAIMAELERDLRVAERAARRRLRETEDLAELAARRPVKAATESKKPAHADQINCSSFR
jgi:hypothetical protein